MSTDTDAGPGHDDELSRTSRVIVV
ncbi:hypothetical protein DSL72_002559 [Monilinia vaccinii-corymbosi]|uniref:Uncharacterized protein n=1 Tax=Monilinia vaccinii-corymbosi TaxID=61207 RepID=A0A8A3PD05_9HELO|nr:hypothetical protein DSL72_002559 [Monilinia vaccinii-corymbosi]